MSQQRQTPPLPAVVPAALVATALLLFSMTAIVLQTEAVFLPSESLSLVELVMMANVGVTIVFDMLAVAWLLSCSKRDGTGLELAALGFLCVVLLMAQKVMADEIGQDMRLGLEHTGEMAVLYAILVLQLTFNALVLGKGLRGRGLRRRA